ncbi:MAG: type II secretion system F family protein [Ilumatobacteraceae bacterium]
MITPIAVAACGSTSLALLLAWRTRPRPGARSTTNRSRRRWIWIIVAAIAAAVVSPVFGFIALIGPPIWRSWSNIRHRAQATRDIARNFPDALDLLVLSIRAGYLPAQAIVEITPFLPQPLRPSFDAVGAAMQLGDRFADALGQLQTRLGPIAQPLVDSLSAADRYGLPLAPVLERLSFEARQQRRRDTDATARELPVRLAMPLVLCTLPSFVLLAIIPLLLGALSSLRT